ncbi:FxsA family protein [Goodfellowiella coeruleoviolacea]|uniref:UPF0716 protein FxsA n=1 Tax=Goodfellowiella coeruleoviolacea TaxID=334858 RepID=A0AAE3GHL0_9PSEU|nr:FxsA family protein [Goodfellowiella coeruleoviolacea]MCP2167529.1 UPF0716 protein FxsA [Goodfellowiella coeruleoviolacea]
MPLLVALLVAVAAEIAVLVAVGSAVGLLPTLALLILASVAGSWLLRRQGARTLRDLDQAVRAGQPPGPHLVDGTILAAAGLLVLLPGFLSDALALLLLIPPVRTRAGRWLVARLTARARRQAAAWPGFAAPRQHASGPEVVDVTDFTVRPDAPPSTPRTGPAELT